MEDTGIIGTKNRYKNSVGRYYLRGLFYEETLSDKSSVLYTLKREDHQGYPSLFRLYMSVSDPTEYKFAVAHLGGWDHWLELTSADWFKPYVEAWRVELITKLQSDALSSIKAVAASEANPNSYHANKYLLETFGKPVEAKKRGRPSKGSLEDEKTHQRSILADIADDAKRLGIN